ncbi:hypothetical protein Slin15195_G100770 [Septoria linicola]|uniref:Uncharacterized protein n=1 Tax=Septoria linicola TaxID=215465 RepID=A0A9Q9B3A8_9PEZI|nr:hypothetical protein Slin14017_G063790 [Septoria linicola]USW56758.1 hypothetical protein Slin15195_G100770 [Septoria linicola]
MADQDAFNLLSNAEVLAMLQARILSGRRATCPCTTDRKSLYSI